MKWHKQFLRLILFFGLTLVLTGCAKCIKVKEIPPTLPTHRIEHKNVIFKAAVLPNGSPAHIEVKDYCPSRDGINEISIGWSETDTGSAEYATITFPSAAFGDGVPEVEVTCCHYCRCELRAYDKNGNHIVTIEHPGPQGVSKTLKLLGGKIARIDVVGAEIGINEVCYDP